MSPILGGRGAGVRAYGFGGAGAPGQVTGLTATNVGSGRAYNNGRIDLSWTAPPSNGAPITGYKIERSTDNSTFTTLVADTGSSSTSYSNTSLTSAQIYYYKVSAINVVGTGIVSSVSSATATTVPQTPTITSVTRSSNTVVSIAFTGANGGASLSAVTATPSPSVSTTSSGTSSPMTATASYAQGTAYTFTITATNANGSSSASSASSSLTPYPLPTLGTFSVSANYPFNYYAVASANNNSGGSVAVGGTNGQNSVGNSYYWTGSSWLSKAGFPASFMNQGFVVATNGDNFQTAGNYQGNPNQSYYSTSDSSWFNATFFPTNSVPWQAVGFTDSNSIHAASQNSGVTGYYRTGTGAWTAASATSPTNFGYSVSDRANNNGYMYPQNGGTSYKLSGLNGTYSASIDFGYRRIAAFAGSNIWTFDTDWGGGLVYIVTSSGLVSSGRNVPNGSGYDWFNQSTFGYLSNELHVFSGRRTSAPDPNYPGINLHYKATIS